MSKIKILELLKKFKEKYAIQYGIEQMGIFGSVARDEATESSDVDVVVKIKTPNPFIIVHIKDDLERQLQQEVDIVRFRDTMNPFLKKRIEAEVVYV